MKIVIEIDEARFKDIQRIASVQLENYHFKTAEQIIANGTPLPDDAEILTIDKRTLKAVAGRFVIYDREWLKEHFNTTEAYLYGGTMAVDVPGTNAGDLISRQAVIEWLKDKDIIKTKNQEENARRELAELPSTQPNLQPTCNQLATDCISRQALLNAISQKEYGHDYDENTDILGLKYVDIIKRMPSVELETCRDLISRQAALEVLDDYAEDIESGNLGIAYSKARMSMCAAPSVEPERKPGKWMWNNHLGEYECSECGYNPIYERTTPDNSEIDKYRYCRWCGSKMEGSE